MMLASYEQKPNLKPANFFDYMINPQNRKSIIDNIVKYYEEFDDIIINLDKIVLTPLQPVYFLVFKKEFYSNKIQTKRINYIEEGFNSTKSKN
ncbi:MAG: hypothetical protein AB8U25_00385 [Rickettsiales endosymbiont of Dermacentor nuttalli]